MRRNLIHLINAGLLIMVFIVFPAISGRNLGSLRISDHSVLFQLTVGGLCLAIALNVVLAWTAVRTRKERALCFGWAGLFGLLLGVVFGQASGWLHFGWLKEWLLRARGLL
jgi:uncharacterized membrane protein YfcA